MSRCPKQLDFFGPSPKSHGGEPSKGKRKTARPLATKTPIHITFRAAQARGRWSLLHPVNAPHVDRIIKNTARKHEIVLMRFANVGNHLHLLIRGRNREGIKHFLRETAGAIAMTVTGARKSHALKRRFWDELAFSRIVPWGRALRTAQDYITKNVFEAAGLLPAGLKSRVQIITLECGPP